MFFKKIEIQNTGPIENLAIDFPKNNDKPKPLIIVGKNGSGKSILISHLINALIARKQVFYDDSGVQQGKVFKYRSPSYITHGKDFSYSKIEFEKLGIVEECQINRIKKEFSNTLLPESIWNKMQDNEASCFHAPSDPLNTVARSAFEQECCLYFPVDRFEDPAWLNKDDLVLNAQYDIKTKTTNTSGRNIIQKHPLKDNINFLLDVRLDMMSEYKVDFSCGIGQLIASGDNTGIYELVIKVIATILNQKENETKLLYGSRQNRRIMIQVGNKIIPNISQLSTGEIQLINLFISILRDTDLSSQRSNKLNEISGTVIVDEIDTHLHVNHQINVLPYLISLFPKIQFIISTHSPLFLMGMEKKFGTNGFDIVNMPTGNRITCDNFSEFREVFDSIETTHIFKEKIQKEIKISHQPVCFPEGKTDVQYIKKAAELLNKNNVLNKIRLIEGGCDAKLKGLWNSIKDNIDKSMFPNKVILIPDCDTKEKSETIDNIVYKRPIPKMSDNPIKKGIENLFSKETIDKLMEHDPSFVNFRGKMEVIKDGTKKIEPADYQINDNKKVAICNWICTNGDKTDFSNFSKIFDIIEECLSEELE